MTIFYLLGQALYPLNYYLSDKKHKPKQWNRFLLMLPTIFITTFKFAICVICLHYNNKNFVKEHESDIIMGVLFVSCEICKTVAVLYQNVAYENLAAEILENFQTIEYLYRNDLHRPISFTSFSRQYIKKMCLALAAYLQVLVFFALQYSFLDEFNLISVLIKVMQLISVIVFLNIVYYVDLLTFNLRHLNTTIAKDTIDYRRVRVSVFVVKTSKTIESMCFKLNKYKHVHFCLWKGSEQINEYFGWTLMAIMLQSFIDMVYISHWQVQVVFQKWNFINVISK